MLDAAGSSAPVLQEHAQGLDRHMSQRGYGDSPYPPTNSGARQRPATGSGRDTSGGYDRESGPLWTESRSPGNSEYGRPSASGRRPEPEEPQYEPPPSRSSRSRWSNPPPRRRRSNQGGGNAQPSSTPAYRNDIAPGYDDPYSGEPGAPPWDEYGQPTDWDGGGQPAPPRSRAGRLGGQFRTPRLRLGGTARPRATRPIRSATPTIRMPTAFTRVELLHDQVAIALLSLAVLSTALMAGVLAGRIGNLPDVVTLRYDAEGSATRWGTTEALWELPLLAGMISLINIVIAWWLSGFDRFASRFVLGTAVLVSVLAWVSLVRFLW